MANSLRIGVLAFHGDVSEHLMATNNAARELKLDCDVREVRTRSSLEGIDGLIIPGGESTVLQKLCEREGMWEAMKQVPAIFGTCAGAILLAKTLRHAEAGQKTLELMDMEVNRNAYGRQAESFEEDIETTLGPVHAVFIRAPKIVSPGNGLGVLAKKGKDVLACEQRVDGRYYLASTFHPEMVTSRFHEYFLKNIRRVWKKRED